MLILKRGFINKSRAAANNRTPDGNWNEIVGRIQQMYGAAQDEIGQQLDQLTSSTKQFLPGISTNRGLSMYEILGLIVIVLDIIAIISVLMGHSSALRKLFWIILILLLPLIGMVLYFLFGRSVEDA